MSMLGFVLALVAPTPPPPAPPAAAPLPQLPPQVGDTWPFRRLTLPPPNLIREGAGTPGPRYWQQRADYTIRATLDTATHTIAGSETLRYANNSPDTLHYLWLQLDQNIYFFFQADDGIRAFHVTGVQTCALPISLLVEEEEPWLARDPLRLYEERLVAAGELSADEAASVRRSEERRVGKERRAWGWTQA